MSGGTQTLLTSQCSGLSYVQVLKSERWARHLLPSYFLQNSFPLCPPVHFPNQNPGMLRFGVRLVAFGNSVHYLAVATRQTLKQTGHFLITPMTDPFGFLLLGRGGAAAGTAGV